MSFLLEHPGMTVPSLECAKRELPCLLPGMSLWGWVREMRGVLEAL